MLLVRVHDVRHRAFHFTDDIQVEYDRWQRLFAQAVARCDQALDSSGACSM
jgi:hypothetical protein